MASGSSDLRIKFPRYSRDSGGYDNRSTCAGSLLKYLHEIVIPNNRELTKYISNYNKKAGGREILMDRHEYQKERGCCYNTLI